jgi:hypothetical protein
MLIKALSGRIGRLIKLRMTEMHKTRGATIFENWRLFAGWNKSVATYEFELLSDAAFAGETSIGPYQLINTIAHASADPDGRVLAPVIVLRVAYHLEDSPRDMTQTDTSKYHGGSLADEIAAVLSVWTGARLRAGRMTREFDPNDSDPRGKPVAYEGFSPPATFLRTARAARIPSATGLHLMNQIDSFRAMERFHPMDEIALIRAVRMYQDGLWVAESQPELAWLLFVSAAETLAVRWDQGGGDHIQALEVGKPELFVKLQTVCPELVPFVSEQLADITGATRKFVKFLLTYLPDAPTARPPAWCQVDWKRQWFRSAFRQVYDYRSKALHTGIPFPAPMCDVPRKFGSEWSAVAERPFALAYRVGDAIWVRDDLPMLLHIFEYVVRNAIRCWWNSVASGPSSTSASKLKLSNE